jgi:hypothetical protein
LAHWATQCRKMHEAIQICVLQVTCSSLEDVQQIKNDQCVPDCEILWIIILWEFPKQNTHLLGSKLHKSCRKKVFSSYQETAQSYTLQGNYIFHNMFLRESSKKSFIKEGEKCICAFLKML